MKLNNSTFLWQFSVYSCIKSLYDLTSNVQYIEKENELREETKKNSESSFALHRSSINTESVCSYKHSCICAPYLSYIQINSHSHSIKHFSDCCWCCGCIYFLRHNIHMFDFPPDIILNDVGLHSQLWATVTIASVHCQTKMHSGPTEKKKPFIHCTRGPK